MIIKYDWIICCNVIVWYTSLTETSAKGMQTIKQSKASWLGKIPVDRERNEASSSWVLRFSSLHKTISIATAETNKVSRQGTTSSLADSGLSVCVSARLPSAWLGKSVEGGGHEKMIESCIDKNKMTLQYTWHVDTSQQKLICNTVKCWCPAMPNKRRYSKVLAVSGSSEKGSSERYPKETGFTTFGLRIHSVPPRAHQKRLKKNN